MKSRTLLAAASLAVLAAPAAEARITRIEITTVESPTFGGYTWPGVGQYEKVVGKAYGEVDPYDRRNRVIVDIELAPRNARGNVEYSFDFYILKPINLDSSADKMMYEPPNRGRKTWGALARVTVDPGGNGNDPGPSITNPTVLANSFLMPRGYIMMWSGWDASADPTLGMNIVLPVARVAPTPANPQGTITGPSYEYFNGNGGNRLPLTYAPANADDKTTPKLTQRVHLDDTPQVLDNSAWSYVVDGTEWSVRLNSGTFVANNIYEFSYTAKEPTVNGLGMAAIRDWLSWVRHAREDDYGNANPLAQHVKRVYTEISSQPGRLLNDFRKLGFNEDEQGRKVFDAHMQWIAAADGLNLNYRFSQPGRTERNRQDHLFVEAVFPFANVMSHDPITGRTDSRYKRCEQTNTCPLGVEIYSANEYWVKAASLLHTDPTGSRDLPDSPYTRNYLISSHQHGTGNGNSRGSCQQLQNPLNSAPVQRALFIALDEWATKNVKPPESRVPRLKDGTLVPPLPQSAVGFPDIPSPFTDTPGPLVTYTGLKTTRYLLDYGLDFYETGIATVNPPVITPPYQDNPANGPIYPSYVPRTDADGNDIAGVRLPDVTVPLATYTGWALRRGAQMNDGCEGSGQMIVFPRTEADRAATDDPRPSVAARYPTFRDYYGKVVKAIDELIAQRLYLCEDAQAELDRLVANGLARGVPAPAASDVIPAAETFPHCQMQRAGRSGQYK